jgi:hypothetical protein
VEGVTSAIVAFLFVCVVFPRLVKNKPQYYAAFAAILLVILLSGLEQVINTGAFRAFAAFSTAVLQVSAMILLILAVGGLIWRQLVGEVNEAIDEFRQPGRHDSEINLRGEVPPTSPGQPAPPASPGPGETFPPK